MDIQAVRRKRRESNYRKVGGNYNAEDQFREYPAGQLSGKRKL